MKPAGHLEKESFPAEPSLALEMLMEQFGNMVLRTAWFYLKDRHLAEDVSQEVFLKAYRHWTDFKGKSRVKTWLTRITINLCMDKIRLKRTTSEEPTDPGQMPTVSQPGVEEKAMSRLQRTAILQHVLKLPAHYHEVLYLYYYLDLSTREIAEVTGHPEGTVRGRLHRARDLLGAWLREEERTP